jgi:hypothetical protein
MPMRLSDYTDYIEQEERIRPLIRAIIAHGAVPDHHRTSAAQFAKERGWKDRDTLEAIEEQRAAVTITSTTTTGLTNTAVLDLVSLMGPLSASSNVIRRAGVPATFEGATSINVSNIIGAGTGFAFITQGAPVPIRQMSFSSTTLTTKKIGAGWVMTRELMEGSNGEAFTRAAAAENLSLGVDAVLFDATAADSLRPAGLRSYAVTLTPTAIGANITQNDAMDKDLAALAGNVAAVAGSLSNIIFIASPDAAVKISLRTDNRFPYELLASSGLPAGTVMALAVNAFAVAADPAPRFSVSKTTAVHMEDTTPLAIGTVGTPPTVAAPVRSLWQTDAVAIKVTFDCDWAMRSASGVSWVTGITW